MAPNAGQPSPFAPVIDRRHTNSAKWDVGDDELPMWVADLDFATAPAVRQAIVAKVASGVFGYEIVPEGFARSIADWWATRYDWALDPAWVQFSSGVMPAVSSLIRSLTEPGQGVVLVSPVYNCFFSTIRQCGRQLLVSDLTYHQGAYRIDWAGLEAAMADPRAGLVLWCNPQNPTGQIWGADELARLGDLAAAHGLVVVSDEIHCDVTAPGTAYVPFARVDPPGAWVSVVSPAKSFGLAGLQAGAVIAADPGLRARVGAGLHRDELTSPNSLAIAATIAAYTQGGPWLDELRQYVERNKQRLAGFVADHLPQLRVVPSQATYLSWIDCSALGEDATEFAAFLRRTTGLFLNPGRIYGHNGRSFVRLNLGCPAELLEDGLERLARGVAAWNVRRA
jgi:cystathionine beta-lyase